MPAMVLTAVALLLFLKRRYGFASVACTLLVLTKETSIAAPAVLGAVLLLERRWREAIYFTAPAIALTLWLAYLYQSNGPPVWECRVHPLQRWVPIASCAFRCDASAPRVLHFCRQLPHSRNHRNRDGVEEDHDFPQSRLGDCRGCWSAATLVVTVLGGAALERYLMPVLPIFSIAAAAALATIRRRPRFIVTAALLAGLTAAMFINPIFPFPFENNAAFIDFVELQRNAASYVEAHYPASTVTSAWPFPDALRRPEFGYVRQPVAVRGIEATSTRRQCLD